VPERTSLPVLVLSRVPEPVMAPPKLEEPVPASVRVPVPSARVAPALPLRLATVSDWPPRLKVPPSTVRLVVAASWFEELSFTVPPLTVRSPSTVAVLRTRVPELTVVTPV